jgi:hypothetical protein
MKVKTLNKHKRNLKIYNGKDVYSYSTKVAIIKGKELWILGHWSQTTSRHINYVADIYELRKRPGNL